METNNPIILPLELVSDTDAVEIKVPASVINPSASGALPPIDVVVQAWQLRGVPDGQSCFPLLRVQAGSSTGTFVLTTSRNEARDMSVTPPFKRRFTATNGCLRLSLSTKATGGVGNVTPLYMHQTLMNTLPATTTDRLFERGNTVVCNEAYNGLFVVAGSPLDTLIQKGLSLDGGADPSTRGAQIEMVSQPYAPATVTSDTTSFEGFSVDKTKNAYPSGVVRARVQFRTKSANATRVTAAGAVLMWNEYLIDSVGFPDFLPPAVYTSGQQPLVSIVSSLGSDRLFSARLDERFSTPITANILVSMNATVD